MEGHFKHQITVQAHCTNHGFVYRVACLGCIHTSWSWNVSSFVAIMWSHPPSSGVYPSCYFIWGFQGYCDIFCVKTMIKNKKKPIKVSFHDDATQLYCESLWVCSLCAALCIPSCALPLCSKYCMVKAATLFLQCVAKCGGGGRM